ncbi:hypothetical protein [Pseudomonas sp. SST3]|uniref:hypothetical protein n=1 Tax=Pseudomonas sp. SST3 TaxID=2267882 RepID=UPI001F50930F|nr:hypothetical protein [Pseudomonas sp. SST3]
MEEWLRWFSGSSKEHYIQAALLVLAQRKFSLDEALPSFAVVLKRNIVFRDD